MWGWLVFVISLIVLGIIIYLTVSTQNKNKKLQLNSVLYPFSGILPAPISGLQPPQGAVKLPGGNGYGLYLVQNGNNSPQISCPDGYKINIVGAFVEVMDPYGVCGTNPSGIYEISCGDQTSTAGANCTTDADCGSPGLMCGANGHCVAATCKANTDCAGSNSPIPACPSCVGTACTPGEAIPASCGTNANVICSGGQWVYNPLKGQCLMCNGNSTTPGTCMLMPSCQDMDPSTYQNTVCNPSNTTTNCRPRDASAYLAKYCDGKSTCLGSANDFWNPNEPNGPFGPLPCEISALWNDTNYTQLPITTGWTGGAPDGGAANSPVSLSQGYYVHGIYTCVPDDENTVAS